ncbi:MAG: suppressor of fused domain protein [Chloroflexota bacterium]|nr:suppressor of fused domain protein [Chloroflexota bacterium]
MSDDGLIDHLEAFLGPITGGWIEGATGDRLPFQVVWFDDAPEKDLATYSTLGLSRHALESPTKTIRQELLVSVEERFASPQLGSVLTTLGEMVLAEHRPVLRGGVLPPRDAIVPESALSAFYAAAPVALPDAFAVFGGSQPHTVFFGWCPSPRQRPTLSARMVGVGSKTNWSSSNQTCST